MTALRTQQVGLGEVKAVEHRLAEALAGGPIRLERSGSVLKDAEKEVLLLYVMRYIFPELFGDPILADVKPRRSITSVKARKLISNRIDKLFEIEYGIQLAGVSIEKSNLFYISTLVMIGVLGAYDPEI